MVQKRKPVIFTFHKWLDAYMTYMLVIVAAYPTRSIELLKYQQIISRAETQFQGMVWVLYNEQFRCRTANDLSLSWDQVDLELWTVLFSGLAKPHCLTCCSPYHKQSECLSADHSRCQPKGPLCFKCSQSSGCTAHSCPYQHLCHRCRSANHSILTCPTSISKDSSRPHLSSSSRNRGKR